MTVMSVKDFLRLLADPDSTKVDIFGMDGDVPLWYGVAADAPAWCDHSVLYGIDLGRDVLVIQCWSPRGYAD